MKTKLQKYFPDLIRSREAVEHEIAQRTGLTLIYNSWTKEQQPGIFRLLHRSQRN